MFADRLLPQRPRSLPGVCIPDVDQAALQRLWPGFARTNDSITLQNVLATVLRYQDFCNQQISPLLLLGCFGWPAGLREPHTHTPFLETRWQAQLCLWPGLSVNFGSYLQTCTMNTRAVSPWPCCCQCARRAAWAMPPVATTMAASPLRTSAAADYHLDLYTAMYLACLFTLIQKACHFCKPDG